MECGCKQPTTKLQLEGEFGADPLWCAICQYNIDNEDIAVLDELKQELLNWANAYGQWADLENNNYIDGGEELEKAHNEMGAQLAKKVEQALGKGYTVQFIASAM